MADSRTSELLSAGPTHLRTSPVAHLHQELAAAAVPGARGISVQEIPFTTQIGLRAAPGSEVHGVFSETLGVGLPSAVGEVTGGPEDVAVLWSAPDEFLVVAPPESHRLFRSLQDVLSDHPGQVVDLSANRTILELRGGSARDALEKGVPADLHPRSFPNGHAVTTTLGPVPVLLWHSAEETYRVLVRCSFAEYLARWLLDALREYSALR